jgi:hypothetical protein
MHPIPDELARLVAAARLVIKRQWHWLVREGQDGECPFCGVMYKLERGYKLHKTDCALVELLAAVKPLEKLCPTPEAFEENIRQREESARAARVRPPGKS